MDLDGASAPSFSFGGVFVVYTMVHAVRDLIYAFTADDMGGVITALCVMGSAIALFRLMRRGAGGR